MNMARRWLVLILAVGVPATAGAQEAYRDARIRHIEPGVSIQRAAETGAEEALANLPFLPGDRVWTDQGGRAEFQFADGTILRVDSRSKLDYVARNDGRREHIVLRLWSGGLYVHGRDPELSVETPGGVVEIDRGGVYRVDVDSGEVRLSVYEGEARLDSARVRAGERAYARRGEAIEGPERFDRAAPRGREADAPDERRGIHSRAAEDEFARWDQRRSERDGRAESRPEYLPEEIAPYADELEGNGTWYYESEVGHVWRPSVGPGWQPYSDGRWVWTAYGWTWVPYEGWGWAPFHYGRWGHSAGLGWYWIPSAGWGPAWVSWAVGPSYVGWCPLGFRDRPALVYDRRDRDRGRAVPRGSVAATSPWTFVRRTDLNARDLGRRRVDAGSDIAQDVRVVDSPRARLTRDVQVGDERAVPRNVRTKPGGGDTVPELRSDPMVTIPAPVPRTRYESERERQREREAERRRPSPRYEGSVSAPAPRAHPTDVRSAPAGAVESGRPRSEERRAVPPAGRAESPDREVMRPLFRPLGRAEGDRERLAPRDGEARSGAERRRPDDAPRARPQPAPRSERPPEARPAPERQPRGESAVRRKKEN
jgi:hypothetical protein